MNEEQGHGGIRPGMETVAQQSEDPLDRRMEDLRHLFPEAFSEGRLDIERLRAALGDIVDEGPERYSFSWAGKRDAIRILQMPTRATLVPVPEESLDWDTTHNVFIEGDNLEVLKVLLRPYYGRVKMIYIDPPYNTGKDFIYPDNYRDPLDNYLRFTGQRDGNGNLLTSNPETSGRYHSNWLTMMYPRLWLARQLLREDGMILVSIDDHELHNLRMIMNEVFGEENALPILIWNMGHSQQQGIFKQYHQYILVYAKSRESVSPFEKGTGEIVAGAMKKISKANPASDFCFPAGTRCEAPDGTEFSGTWGDTETVKLIKGRFLVKDNRLVEDVVLRAGWTQLEQMKKYFAGEDVIDTRGQRVLEFYFSSTGKLKYRKERKRITPSTVLEGYGTQSQATSELAELFAGTRMLDYPKPVRLIRDLVYWITECDEEDLVLDFFAGSCTTAQAVLELNHEDGGNRRFIMVQLPAPTPEGSAAREAGFTTVAEIGKERIRRVIARLKEEEKQGLDLTDRKTPEDLGFRVFKLAPSNYRSWTGVETMGEQPPDPQVYVEQLAMFIDTLDDGWTPPNVVAEVALKEAGFGLNYATETVQGLEGQTVYRVTDPDREQVFYLCLDDEVRLEALRPLGLNRDTLFVCRASALDDETAANLALQCRLKVI